MRRFGVFPKRRFLVRKETAVKKITESINTVALIMMLLLTVGQILFRTVLQISASWSEELTGYCFAFIVFVGAIAVTNDEAHITITMLLDVVSSRWKRVFRMIGRIVMLPFLIIFSWGAFQNTQTNWSTSLPTAEWMKIGYMYGVLFVSGVLMTYYLAVNTVLDILGKKSDPTPSGGIQ
jgi:TRAP-type transport system small permease protein